MAPCVTEGAHGPLDTRSDGLHIEIQEEFIGMRAQFDRIHLMLRLVFDPYIYNIRRKDIALEKERMVLLQCGQCLGE